MYVAMKLWKKPKPELDETILQIDKSKEGITTIYVKAQSSQKALELINKLSEKSK